MRSKSSSRSRRRASSGMALGAAAADKNVAVNVMWLVRFLATVLLYIVAKQQQASLWVCAVVKMLPMLVLCHHVGRSSGTRSMAAMSGQVAHGLLLSSFGDFFLEISHGIVEDDKTKKRLFLIGLVSFLVAHVYFVRGFYSVVKTNLDVGGQTMRLQHCLHWSTGAVLVLVLSVLSYVFTHSDKISSDPVLKTAVPLYGLALLCLGVVACLRYRSGSKSKQEALALAGAFLFIFSDSIIAIDKFCVPVAHAKLIIMVTYWTAQLFFVFGCHPLTAFF